MNQKTNSRAVAAKILTTVTKDQRSLTSALSNGITSQISLSTEDRAFIQELCYGVLRHYHRLCFFADQLLHKPLRSKDDDVKNLLLVGIYQLLYTKTPSYAAVSATVSGADILKKTWAKGLLNKTLRTFIDQTETLNQDSLATESINFSHPTWMIESIKKAWPSQWEAILTANNLRAPMSLRVNPQKTTRDEYLEQLKQQGIEASPITGLAHGIQLTKPLPVNMLPNFNEGFCSVQDASGQKVITLLDCQPKQRVLDACAAPGSKTCHILETTPDLTNLTAIDIDAERLTKIKENIMRLQLNHQNFHLVLADASHTKQWWDGTPFDRILLDAPCSATGVIRRHPDIKVLRQPDDIKSVIQQQQHLLNHLWPLLAKNGKLIYTTCSVLPDENEKQINAFLNAHKNAKILKPKLEWPPQSTVISLPHGLQVLPTENGMDGFYYAVIVKQ